MVAVGIGVASQLNRDALPTPPAKVWPSDISPPPTTLLDPNALPLGAPVRVPTPYVDISTAGKPVVVTREDRRTLPEGSEVLSLRALPDGMLAIVQHARQTELLHFTDSSEATIVVTRARDLPPGGSRELSFVQSRDGWRFAVPEPQRADGTSSFSVIDLNNPQEPQADVLTGIPLVWLDSDRVLTWDDPKSQTNLALFDVTGGVRTPVVAPDWMTGTLLSVPGSSDFLHLSGEINGRGCIQRLDPGADITDIRSWTTLGQTCGDVSFGPENPAGSRVVVRSVMTPPVNTGSLDLATGKVTWLPNLLGARVDSFMESDDAMIFVLTGDGNQSASARSTVAVRCFFVTARCERAPDPDQLVTGSAFPKVLVPLRY